MPALSVSGKEKTFRMGTGMINQALGIPSFLASCEKTLACFVPKKQKKGGRPLRDPGAGEEEILI